MFSQLRKHEMVPSYTTTVKLYLVETFLFAHAGDYLNGRKVRGIFRR